MLKVTLRDVVVERVAACEPNYYSDRIPMDAAHAEYVEEGGLFRVRVYTHDWHNLGQDVALADIPKGRPNQPGTRLGARLDAKHLDWDAAHTWRAEVADLLNIYSTRFWVCVEKEGI